MKRLLSASLSFTLALALVTPGRVFAENPEKDPDQIGNRNVSGKVNFYSLEKEIALGKQLATEVERQAKIINDPVIAEYVNRVGQNLVRNSDAKVPFTIKVIDSEEVNAFALPGGFFFVNSGLILRPIMRRSWPASCRTRSRMWRRGMGPGKRRAVRSPNWA